MPTVRKPSALDRWMKGETRHCRIAMHSTAPVMISSPRQAPGGAADNPVASAAATPSTAIADPDRFPFRQRLDAE